MANKGLLPNQSINKKKKKQPIKTEQKAQIDIS